MAKNLVSIVLSFFLLHIRNFKVCIRYLLFNLKQADERIKNSGCSCKMVHALMTDYIAQIENMMCALKINKFKKKEKSLKLRCVGTKFLNYICSLTIYIDLSYISKSVCPYIMTSSHQSHFYEIPSLSKHVSKFSAK